MIDISVKIIVPRYVLLTHLIQLPTNAPLDTAVQCRRDPDISLAFREPGGLVVSCSKAPESTRRGSCQAHLVISASNLPVMPHPNHTPAPTGDNSHAARDTKSDCPGRGSHALYVLLGTTGIHPNKEVSICEAQPRMGNCSVQGMPSKMFPKHPIT